MLAGDLAREIRYSMRIGEDQEDGSYTNALHVLNEAGERIVTAKRWMFLGGGMAAVKFSDTGEGELPPDFAELTSVYFPSGAGQIQTIERVQSCRGQGMGTAVAVSTKGTEEGMHYFLASNGSGGQCNITYRRGWLTVKKDSDPILMPEWMRPLLSEVCRRYAEVVEGAREEGVGPTIVDAVIQGPLFREAAVRDGLVQRHLGRGSGRVVPGTSIYVPLVKEDWRQP